MYDDFSMQQSVWLEKYMRRTLLTLSDALGSIEKYNNYILGKDDAMNKEHKIKVALDELAFMPNRAYDADAGYDIFSPVDFTVPSFGSKVIDTGVHIQIPSGYVGFLKSKSGLNVKFSILGEGVIDSGYTGSIRAKLYNHGDKDVIFKRGMKMIQLVILPVFTPQLELADSLEESDRGNNGFGSTGK